jgi:hypothetical protein
VEKIDKGQKANQTLAGTSSQPEGTGPSVSDIADMNDEEFDAFWAKFEREQTRH